MRVVRRSVRHCGAMVSVPTYEAGAEDTDRIIMFLNGLSRRPTHYRFLDALADEQGARLVAPFLFGNGYMDVPSLETGVDLALSVSREVDRSQTLLLGHSTGGLAAMLLARRNSGFAGVITLNGALPVAYGPLGFAWRGAWLGARHFLGLSGARTLSPRVLLEAADCVHCLLRSPRRNLQLVRELACLRLVDLEGMLAGSGTRTGIVFGAGDEFFSMTQNVERRLRLALPDVRIVRLSETRSHEWPLVDGARASACVADLVAELKIWNA
jgi:pimeloyl-ACP methyl ester carboxylesterase